MNRQWSLIGGIGLGAGLMYLLDPDRGRRRRAGVRDKVARAIHVSRDALDTTRRDFAHRVQGVGSITRRLLRSQQPDDDVLVARVRTKLGRLVSHPGSIEVSAQDGRVTLRGPVLQREMNRLIDGVVSVRGVCEVDNQLEVHKQARDVPGLQGGPPGPKQPQLDVLQTNWAPATRFVAGTAGGAMAAWGIRQGGVLGAALGVAGLGLLARGASNLELKRLTGVGAGRRAVDVRKTININAPIERVYEFWTQYENFPRIMSHLKDVRDLGNRRSRWTASGPAGTTVEWDAEITELIPNRVLAWKSVRGSGIENSGIVRFDPNPDGSTRVDVRISYNPPAGGLGHAVASLFGKDPRKALHDDMVRVKSLLEIGKTTAHHEKVVMGEPGMDPGRPPAF
ncbi:MAG: SRPBCC family protein [Acidobacteria bacterium]|nr:SRPBCC family protein [Acidobacteriota bacterium]